MHSINLIVLKKQDAIDNNIEYYELNKCSLVVTTNEIKSDIDYLNVETDYFGGCGEQYASSKNKTYNSINEGLYDVFKLEKNKDFDQFDIVGLGNIRTNSDLYQLKFKSIDKYLYDDNILNIYVFGSQVYGTFTHESDVDYIIVAKEYFESNDINIHVYTVNQFQFLIDRFDIQALECLLAPLKFRIKEKYNFIIPILDKQKLRVSISTITSNSWVKGKKKLTVAGDYDLHLAIKSIFHSLRILDFGIQIVNSKTIQNYGSMNYILDDLKKLSKIYQREELWQKIDDKYRKLYNSKSSEFKLLAPKDLSDKNNKDVLQKIFKKYNINYTSDIIDEILNVFNK